MSVCVCDSTCCSEAGVRATAGRGRSRAGATAESAVSMCSECVRAVSVCSECVRAVSVCSECVCSECVQ